MIILCQVKLNAHQSDYSHYSKKFKTYHLITLKHILRTKNGYSSSRSHSFYYVYILLFFRTMVVKKAFDVTLSATKLSLCTAYNQLSVTFYV